MNPSDEEDAVEDQWEDSVSAQFDPLPDSVRAARRFVATALGRIPEEQADDAALLTSELATNAVIHANSRYTVTVKRDGGRVRVEVSDGSAGAARRCHYSPTSGTGRGLGMVEDLSTAWGVEEDGVGGKVVWFELTAPAPRSLPVTEATTERSTDTAGEADLDALLEQLGGWDDDEGPASAPGPPQSRARLGAAA